MRNVSLASLMMVVIGLNIGCGQAPAMNNSNNGNQVRTPETTCMFSWEQYMGPKNLLISGNGDGTFVPAGCTSGQSDACLSPEGNTVEIVANGQITCEGVEGYMNVVNGIPTWVTSQN